MRSALTISLLSLVTGCVLLHPENGSSTNSKSTATKIEVRDNPEHIKSVAGCLGLRVSSDRTAPDVVTDIKILIDDSERQMPEPLSDVTITKLEKLLKPDERKILWEYQRAVRDAKGKRVLYLPNGE